MSVTYTPRLNFSKLPAGYLNFDIPINSNWDLADAAYGTVLSAIDSLPETYLLTDTFSGTAGVTVTLPKSVDAVNEYSVSITPTTRTASIGDIEVEKSTANFVVKSHGNNTADDFMAIVSYVGDVSTYGVAIFRKWYVSPESSITDHSDVLDTGSLAWVINEIGANPAVVEFPGNRTYVINDDVDATANTDEIYFIFQPGAVIRPAATKSFTVKNPFHIQAPGNQQIIDTTNNATDPLIFEGGEGETHTLWFGTGSIGAQAAINSLNSGSGFIRLHSDTWTSGVTISNSYQQLVGYGKNNTTISFNPSGSDTAITIDYGSSAIAPRECALREFTLDATGNTQIKYGIKICNVEQFTLERVNVREWSDSSYSCEAFLVQGKDTSKIDQCYFNADIPVKVEQNPYRAAFADIDIDHFCFTSCIFLGVSGEYAIQIDSGINLTNVQIEKTAVVLAKGMLYWVDTTTTKVSYALSIRDCRAEQEPTGDYCIDIQHNLGLQSLKIDQFRFGTSGKGIKLRQVDNASIVDSYYTNTVSAEALNVDSTVRNLELHNTYWQSGTTVTMTGQQLMWGQESQVGPLPKSAVYKSTDDTALDNNLVDSPISGATENSLAIDGVAEIAEILFNGFVFVSTSLKTSAIYNLRGNSTAVVEVSDPSSDFSVTFDNSGTVNIYWDSGNSRYSIQNKTGGAITATWVKIGNQ